MRGDSGEHIHDETQKNVRTRSEQNKVRKTVKKRSEKKTGMIFSV